MPIINNTVRLKAEFKTFDELYADPSTITLKVYDKHRRQIGSSIDETQLEKVATGIYQYDYTIPSGYDEITYEFSGILEGKQITGRSTIETDWS